MKRITILLATVLHFVNCYGDEVLLQSDLGVNGSIRYCRYSDGKVYTFNALDFCEMAINTNDAMGIGDLVGEKKSDDMNKICIYDVMGEKKSIRVSIVSLCPISQKFR